MSSILNKTWNINFDQMYMTPTLMFKRLLNMNFKEKRKPAYSMEEYCIYLRFRDGHIQGWTKQRGLNPPFTWQVVFEDVSALQKDLDQLYMDYMAEKYILGAR